MSEDLYAQVLKYVEQGWKPVPIKFREKGPTTKDWKNLELDLAAVKRLFGNGPANVGIILGERSGHLTDVDLDCPEAVALAPYYLPPTLTFGRDSNRKSHWLYTCEGAGKEAYTFPEKRGGKDAITLIELRGNGGLQTVFPGSTHKDTGELIRFEPGPSEPAHIRREDLEARVKRIAVAAAWAIKGVPLELLTDIDIGDMTLAEVLDPAQEKTLRKWTGNQADLKGAKNKTKILSPEQQLLVDARTEYNTKHARDFGRPGSGQCPVCGDSKSFGGLPDDPTRWYCFSTDHAQLKVEDKPCGRRGEKGFYGDCLDLDAFGAGVSPRELLITDIGRKKGLIQVTVDKLVPMLDKAERLIGDGREIFSRRQGLVEVFSTDKGPTVAPVTPARLTLMLAKTLEWVKWSKSESDWITCYPPPEWVRMLHELRRWEHVAHLGGVSSTPILHRDGSIHATYGYDEVSKVFYVPTEDIPYTIAPTLEDAQEGCMALAEVVEDFPFVEEKHISVWIAAVLSRVGWAAFEGGSPMTVIDATAASSGKTKLANLVSLIATGGPQAAAVFEDKKLDDEELRKKISAWVAAGAQICCLDNIREGSDIGWPCLNALLTSQVWEDRKLGTSEMIREEANMIWLVTGNRLNVVGDAKRRTLQILLAAAEESPEQRNNFHRPEEHLDAWVLRERPRLLAAAFDILRAYMLAGKPDQKLRPMGSFGGWSGLVRSAIVWAGMADPGEACAANAEVDSDDEMAAALKSLVRLWPNLDQVPGQPGVTLSSALTQVAQSPMHPLQEVIRTLCPSRENQLPDVRYFGRKTKMVLDRVYEIDGKKVAMRRKKLNHIVFWAVAEVEDKTK
jgi:hypothetical protein